MTTKPKAKKYRIRRSASLAGPLNKPADDAKNAGDDDQGEVPFATSDDGFGDEPYPTARTAEADYDPKVIAEIEAIKAEGATGRQLRLARRVAQKRGLSAVSDYDAVRLLRERGIDPFKRSTMLSLVVPEGEALNADVRSVNLPAAKKYDETTRAQEVYRIQRDIARRRRRQMAMMFARLGTFVALPTIVVGIYFYNVATPLFATKSEFLIQQADSQGAGGLGGLFSGTGFATSQDSITVQSYLQSRDAMLRLDADIGFKEHFGQPEIDVLRRLPPDATNEKAYRLYEKMVKISYDPTEGIVKMEVLAASPDVSAQYSRALIAYAEEQVDNLTQRLREDQMQGSHQSFEDAEAKMLDAQRKVLELQERLGVIDAATETSALMGQITVFETQIQERKLQLQQLLDNTQPNRARVDGVSGDISRLEALVAEMRAQLTDGGSDSASLARISAELRLAEIDLEIRTAMMRNRFSNWKQRVSRPTGRSDICRWAYHRLPRTRQPIRESLKTPLCRF